TPETDRLIAFSCSKLNRQPRKAKWNFRANFGPLHEPRGSGPGVPPAAGASRPRIRRGRDAREDSRDGCPTTDCFRFMVPMRAHYGVGASHEPSDAPQES